MSVTAQMSQNNFKVLWCIENENINSQWNFYVLTVIRFWNTIK